MSNELGTFLLLLQCYALGTGSKISRIFFFTAAALAQSVEPVTAEREVAGSIPGSGPIIRVLK